MTAEPYKSSAKSVTARALAVLAAFDVEHPHMTLSQLARRAGLPVATVYRLAGELEDARYLNRDNAGKYGLGVKLWEMGLLTPVHGRLRETAMPFLLNLQYECRETVQLAVRDGTDAIYVEKLTSEESVPVESRIGARIPLHATGVGKALLAFSDEFFIEAMLALPLPRFSPETITDRRVLSRQLTQIRQRGYAASHQEYHWGSTSIAVPVQVNESVQAAIGIVSYTLREDLLQHLPALVHAASGLSQRLEQTEGFAYPGLSGIVGNTADSDSPRSESDG
ncbi:IclR family transcriptional regulator [Rhodococcus sp. IEGM 1330]|uniref:IclR family transcriptional regulator n=1 Tax=Rhodococcus sp. IEGM 1330 TaxID=3082225 RepID=UPI002954D82F|nr:IclR family transcriptional regulator [Rhodococcus sp. IEGM 1330]MDV8022718.1 IclR family transcriptional regulator [Rhodococcus sp. IEGM 1330]